MAKKDGSKESESPEPQDEIREVIRRGLKFSEELLAENERLRFRLASLEATVGDIEGKRAAEVEQTVAELKARVEELEAEKQRLLDSFKEVETANRDYQSRYAEIEEEHNNLANLYIASFQLHSSLAFPEVVQIVAEIVINLVGVHRFGLYLADGDTGVLRAVFAEGQPAADLPPITVGEGPLGEQVAAGQVSLHEDASAAVRAVVPLSTTDRLIGAIVVHELLVQKVSFSGVDQELFHLLGAHAATALVTALVHYKAGGDVATALDLEVVRKLLSGGAGQ